MSAAPHPMSARHHNGIGVIVEVVQANDVLVGTGRRQTDHGGNARLNLIALEYKEAYDDCSEDEQRFLASEIVDTIHESDGRFLKQNDFSFGWIEIRNEEARRFVQHLLQTLPIRNNGNGNASTTATATSTTIVLGPYDVFLGRGKRSSEYAGNARFREIVSCYKVAYDKSTKAEKTKLAMEIVNQIKQAGGRFLKHDDRFGMMVEVEDVEARGVVSQLFRSIRAKKAKQACGRVRRMDGSD